MGTPEDSLMEDPTTNTIVAIDKKIDQPPTQHTLKDVVAIDKKIDQPPTQHTQQIQTFQSRSRSALKSLDRLQQIPTATRQRIITYFGYKAYALFSRTSKYLREQWKTSIEQGLVPIHVPDDCTIKEAVEKVGKSCSLTTIVVGKGKHNIATDVADTQNNCIEINAPMTIVGATNVSKQNIILLGGVVIQSSGGNVHLQHMTLRQSKECGVLGKTSFSMEDMIVEHCGFHGVAALDTDAEGRCTNVEVRYCKWSGVCASNGGSLTLMGSKTTIHSNCTSGKCNSFGLKVHGSSLVQLVFPLTKETVSTNNGGGGDFNGDIDQIKTIESTASNETTLNNMRQIILGFFTYKDFVLTSRTCKYLQVQWKDSIQHVPLYVPEDCCTLNDAVKRAEVDCRITSIVLGKGTHAVENKGNCAVENGSSHRLIVRSSIIIMGKSNVSNKDVVVVGGIRIKSDIGGNVHLQNFTMAKAKKSGVFGRSSFTMEDVVIEQSGCHGVVAAGRGVEGRCTNVQVRQCGGCGVFVTNGGSITLIGMSSSIQENCSNKEKSETNFGLYVSDSSSTIQLVSPLVKEDVSINNGGGGNWGVAYGDVEKIKQRGIYEYAAATFPSVAYRYWLIENIKYDKNEKRYMYRKTVAKKQ